MVRRRGDLHAWQFICKLLGLVDQNGQALRANMFFCAFEGKADQWDLLICAIAIQAYFLSVHGFSNIFPS
jgi:hypothetical protein